ncbi:NUDIX hydrolase, partial [Candidatus Micrarchaeota archaeon]|nr:NUDIX hydrolase [Candidatus Micrarchaeota archaeon]
GLKTRVMRLVGVYSDPERDPIGHKVSVCYLVKRTGGRECKSRETKEITFFDLKKLPRLGFDHEKMIRDALKRN